MTPMLMCLEPKMARHPAVAQGSVDPMHYVTVSPVDPNHNTSTDIAVVMRWVSDNPKRPLHLQLGSLGKEGFNVDERDGDGNLIGCTPDEFARGMAGGGFKRTRDLETCRAINASGLRPETILIDAEYTSQVPWNAPMVDRTKYDGFRFEHLYGILRDSGLLAKCKNVVVEFVQFSTDPNAQCWDYNGTRCPILRPVSRRAPGTLNYVRGASSSEFYSDGTKPVNDATIKLAAYLSACASGAFPILQPANPSMLKDQLAICERYKATPVIYCNPIFGGSVDWQMDRLGEALVG